MNIFVVTNCLNIFTDNRKPFAQGDKVSLTGEVYWCNACLEDAVVKSSKKAEELSPRKSKIQEYNENESKLLADKSSPDKNNKSSLDKNNKSSPEKNIANRSSKMSPIKADHDIVVPTVNGNLQSSTPHRPHELLVDGHLGSPTSDTSDLSDSELLGSLWI